MIATASHTLIFDIKTVREAYDDLHLTKQEVLSRWVYRHTALFVV